MPTGKWGPPHPGVRFAHRTLLLALAAGALGACTPAGTHAPARLEFVQLEQAGCGSREFSFFLRRRNLGGGTYVVRTEAVVDGRHYMDERATIHLNGTYDWTLYDDHSYSPGARGADWPMPAGRPLRVTLTVTRPAGQFVDRQAFGFDGCDSGLLLLRSAVMADGFE